MARVILLHGLHMHAWVMKPFANLLIHQGFGVSIFGYLSVWRALSQHTLALHHFVEHQPKSESLHFVGHSLGGLVLRHFAAQYSECITGRIVTLGTPHLGSAAAERVCRLGLRKPVLGGSYRLALDGNAPLLPEKIELGSIAGNKPQGLGRVLGLHGEHDGTVLVNETKCKNLRDHIVLPVSHSGMLFSQEVANQTAYFLNHGRFLSNT